MKKLSITFFGFVLALCVSGQTIKVVKGARIYDSTKSNAKLLTTIPADTVLTVTGMQEVPDEYSKYFEVKYDKTSGWVFLFDVVMDDNYYATVRKYFKKGVTDYAKGFIPDN